MVPNLSKPPANITYQQDEAPPHHSRAVRDLLGEKLPDFWIGKGGFEDWPARSPDVTSLEFFLRGYVIDNVFKTRCISLIQLKRRITSTAQNIPTDMPQNVLQNSMICFSAVSRKV